jgi:CubicO group peptidase (beta-lactamase class C family)
MKSKLIQHLCVTLISAITLIGCASTKKLTAEQQVDKVLEKYNLSNSPGASVVVYKDDKIIFSKGYGLQNIQTQEPVTPQTNFRLASVTKQFTAMSILLLEKNKKLSLEDPLRKYFSSFPEYGKNIKIKHLLTHSSGLIDYEDLMPATQQTQLHDTNCLQLMYSTNKLYFPAGTDYRYSNTGYAILALIVEKVSGKDFNTFVKENIFKPLNMKNTVAHVDGKDVIPNRAYGHTFENGAWKQTDQSLTSAVLGDGGIYTNVEDYCKWMSALWNYKLLPSDLQNRAWSKTKLDNGKVIDYGYGWHLETFNDIEHPFHDGSSIGFRNSVLVFPTKKLMVLVLTNRNEPDPIEEAKKIATIYYN